MNIHTFKFKIMAYILSIVTLVIVSVSATSFIITYYTINSEINEKMPIKLEAIINDIENKLSGHSSLVKSAASLAQTSRGKLSRKGYVDFLKNTVNDNKSSYGFGIWFEPYVYSSSYKFFGPYAYRDGEKVLFTADYETEKYNFHKQDWYLNGKKAKENHIIWSYPFYDDASGVTMVSAVSPILNASGLFEGVASGDFDISEIQKMISEIKDTKTDLSAFLILKDGTFLSYENKEFIMKKKITEVSNRSLSDAGKDIIKNLNGQTSYQNEEGTQRIYYSNLGETGWILGVTVSQSKLFAPLKKMGIAIMIVVLISLAVSIIISLIIAGRISNPVRKMNDFASLLARGDFTHRVKIKQNDEIGLLARALNSSADNLEELISGVLGSAQNLNQAVDEISRGNMNLSQRTSQQASALEEIAATIEENTSTVERNAENSKTARDLTDQGAEISATGSEQAAVAISSINEINESSKKISEIITVINDIAFQTNLLALNAAVEAARAGDQGRGFAVVAGEVRNLAQRSAEAAKEIKNLIFESVEKVENGTELVIKTGNFLKEIAQTAKSSADLIGEVAAASDEQRAGMEQINKAIVELDSMTQQNAALVEETASASEEMANQASEMLTLMARFKIKNSALAAQNEKSSVEQKAAVHKVIKVDNEPESKFKNQSKENSVKDFLSDQEFEEF